jgi:hypothetical protein
VQYAVYTALIATSHVPLLLFGYLEAHLGRLLLWLWDWMIAINFSNITTFFSLKAARHIKTQIRAHSGSEKLVILE